ncbi:MAG: hypothetical protein LN415_07415 [Candidatus Thermoplasmatota archaeon]|nr:hypothetical protein [Candidatus Thermoplasmatota archaeon]
MLDFVGNSEFFNEGFGYSEGALAVDGEEHGLHSRAEMQTLEGEDAWIWREWLDVEPGGEAVDSRDSVVGVSKAQSLTVSAGPSRSGSLFTSAGYRTLEAGRV